MHQLPHSAAKTAGTASFSQRLRAIEPTSLAPVIVMSHARSDTFHYRNMDKRVIDYSILDDSRWSRVAGPTLYLVTDTSGLTRYVGKHEGQGPIRSRWIRRNHLHHQESSRNRYIAHLESGSGVLTLRTLSSAELRELARESPNTGQADAQLVRAAEAILIDQLWATGLLWNQRREAGGDLE
jgi:hypothetical protein